MRFAGNAEVKRLNSITFLLLVLIGLMPSVLLGQSAPYSVVSVSCPGGTDGEIELLGLAGSSHSFAWSNGTNKQNLSGLSAGNYTVTVTDNFGNNVIFCIPVSEPEPTIRQVSKADADCPGEASGAIEVRLGGGAAPYSYSVNGSSPKVITSLDDYWNEPLHFMGPGSARITCMKTSPLGLTYIAGDFTGSVSFNNTTFTSSGNSNIFLVCLNKQGNVVWAQQAGGSFADAVNGIAMGPCGNVFITGRFEETANFGSISLNAGSSTSSLFVAKYDNTGAEQWARSVQGFDNSVGHGIAADFEGNSYITGSFTGSGQFDTHVMSANGISADLFVAKLDPDGLYDWAYSFGGSTGVDRGRDLALDDIGNIYLTGQFEGSVAFGTTTLLSSGHSDIFVAKLTPNGTVDWAQGMGSGSFNETGMRLFFSPTQQTVTVCGQFTGSAQFGSFSKTAVGSSDAFVTQLTSGGNIQWVETFGGSNADVANDVVVDQAGFVYVTGDFQGSAAFSGNNLPTTANNSSIDPFVFKLTSQGNPVWVENPSGSSTEHLTSIALIGSSSLLVGGGFDGSMTIGSYPALAAQGSEDVFIGKMDLSIAIDSITGLAAGQHIIQTSNILGCTDTAAVMINEPPAFQTAATTKDVNCFGESNGTLKASVSGGTPGYSYLWGRGTVQLLDSVSSLSAGPVLVTITDGNNCIHIDTFQVNQPTALGNAFNVVSNISCNGAADGILTAVPNGGIGPYTYLWDSTFTSDTISNLMVGLRTVVVTDARGCSYKDTLDLQEPPTIVTNLQKTDVACHGDSTGSLALNVVGGTIPYTYAWNNNLSTNPAHSSLPANSYNVTVTDIHGCIKTDSIKIVEPVDITSELSIITNVWCHGDSNGVATVQYGGGTGPYHLNWSNNQADTVQATNLWAGNHWIIITDSHQCKDTTYFQVTQPQPLTLNFQIDDVSCYGGNNGVVHTQLTGGTPPYNYLWDDQSSASSLAGLVKGEYNLYVNDVHNCATAASAVVDQPTELLGFVDDVSDISCHGSNDGWIKVKGQDGSPPYAYTWNNGSASSDSIFGLGAGTYNVTITDADSNCAVFLTPMVIDEPMPITTQLDSFTIPKCHGGNDGWARVVVSGGIGNHEIIWQSQGVVGDEISNLDAGTHTVWIRDANQCKDTLTIDIPQPSPIAATEEIVQNVRCYGENNGVAKISATGGTGHISYIWPTGQTRNFHTKLTPAVPYVVTVNDENGCSTTHTFQITQPDQLIAKAGKTDIRCHGDRNGSAFVEVIGGTPDLESGFPYKYLWSRNDELESEITNLKPGVYSVTVTDDEGCQAISEVELIQREKLIPDFSMDRTETTIEDTEVRFTDLSSGPISEWDWDFGGFGRSKEANPSFEFPADSGFYPVRLTVSDLRGCQEEISLDFRIRGAYYFYMPNAFSPNGDGLNDVFKPKGRSLNNNDYSMAVFNRWGMKVFESNDPNRGWDGNHKSKPQPVGVYTWTMTVRNPFSTDGKVEQKTGSVYLLTH